MKIKDFQLKIAAALNTVEALVQGGCKALAEDLLTVSDDVRTQLATVGGVAIVVTTPNLNRNGCTAGAIPVETRLSVKCMEIVATNREAPGHLTALDAAEIVAHSLDGAQFNFAAMNQAADRQSGVLTVSVDFNTTIHLTND